MFKKNSIATAMVLSATATAFVSINAQAENAATETADVERIEVTGSRINRTDMETRYPLP